MLRDWDKLPTWMKCPEVKEYYDILEKRKLSLKVKRIFDITVASVLLIVLAIPMIVVAMMIKLDSQGLCFSARKGSQAMVRNLKYISFVQW